jgi:hypothetical protein
LGGGGGGAGEDPFGEARWREGAVKRGVSRGCWGVACVPVCAEACERVRRGAAYYAYGCIWVRRMHICADLGDASAGLPRDVRQHEFVALDLTRLVAELAFVVLRAPFDLDLVVRFRGEYAQLDVLQRVGFEHLEMEGR